jgi:hypothetical protein
MNEHSSEHDRADCYRHFQGASPKSRHERLLPDRAATETVKGLVSTDPSVSPCWRWAGKETTDEKQAQHFGQSQM